MDDVRLRYLLEKHVANTISVLESKELVALLKETDFETQDRLLTEILEESTYRYTLPEHRKDIVYEKIREYALENQSGNGVGSPGGNIFSFFKKYISVAAVLFVGLSIGFWLWTERQDGVKYNNKANQIVRQHVNDIYLDPDSLPTLQLPDGNRQLLTTDIKNSLRDVGVKLLKSEDGQVIYEVQQHGGSQNLLPQKKVVFSTPKGHASRILLADGTQVWLNSGSSLEYPVFFSGTDRRVKLQGEGYFDVAHNKEQPFYVETDLGPLIQVLGTSFNVSAYEGEHSTTTTLVRGSVRLISDDNNMVLIPNEQVIAGRNERMWTKSKVNVDDIISWKDGYFSFNASSVEDILDKVQRWYNIEEIEYKYQSEEEFTGTFKRTKSLRSLLEKLEKISNIKFDIKERRIVVTQ